VLVVVWAPPGAVCVCVPQAQREAEAAAQAEQEEAERLRKKAEEQEARLLKIRLEKEEALRKKNEEAQARKHALETKEQAKRQGDAAALARKQASGAQTEALRQKLKHTLDMCQQSRNISVPVDAVPSPKIPPPVRVVIFVGDGWWVGAGGDVVLVTMKWLCVCVCVWTLFTFQHPKKSSTLHSLYSLSCFLFFSHSVFFFFSRNR
jgi:hypothetical protein